MMFYLDPEDLVTDSLVEQLQGFLGTGDTLDRTELVDVLGRIFSGLDGFPIFERELDGVERTALAEGLLTDATVKILRMSGYSHVESGFVLESAVGRPLTLRVSASSVVPVNFAGAQELEALPGVGSVLAEEIISERLRAGPFLSMQELTDRIDGIGSQIAERLARVLSFRFPEAGVRVLPVERDLGRAMSLLMSLTPGETNAARLRAALDQIATTLAADLPIDIPEIPHPVQRDTNHDEFLASAVESLIGSAYHQRALELIEGADSGIDVCMFHIALPSEDHPTRKLLSGLLSAHARGVTVRVLIDQDRPTDPYGSTIINSPARDLLNRDTELCRFDDQSVLLHSKYMIFDRQVVVLGSHNWTAGSFFGFDDLSVVVHSTDYAAYITARFSDQWNAAVSGR